MDTFIHIVIKLIHSINYSFIHSIIHASIHSFIHSFIYLLSGISAACDTVWLACFNLHIIGWRTMVTFCCTTWRRQWLQMHFARVNVAALLRCKKFPLLICFRIAVSAHQRWLLRYVRMAQPAPGYVRSSLILSNASQSILKAGIASETLGLVKVHSLFARILSIFYRHYIL